MDASGQFYGGHQDKGSHHISGGDPNNEGTGMDFEDGENDMGNQINSENRKHHVAVESAMKSMQEVGQSKLRTDKQNSPIEGFNST